MGADKVVGKQYKSGKVTVAYYKERSTKHRKETVSKKHNY